MDSVNALYDTIADLLTADFGFIHDPARLHMLKVLALFTLGSVVGLVTFSHILSYILKHYKNITIATIIGFIVGSLGVVWPWKDTLYRMDAEGTFVLDSTGDKIVANYVRYIPELTFETFLAIFYIVVGILIILGLAWYGDKMKIRNARIRSYR